MVAQSSYQTGVFSIVNISLMFPDSLLQIAESHPLRDCRLAGASHQQKFSIRPHEPRPRQVLIVPKPHMHCISRHVTTASAAKLNYWLACVCRRDRGAKTVHQTGVPAVHDPHLLDQHIAFEISYRRPTTCFQRDHCQQRPPANFNSSRRSHAARRRAVQHGASHPHTGQR